MVNSTNVAHSHQHEPTSQPVTSSNDQEAQMISVAEHASLRKCSSRLVTDVHKMDKFAFRRIRGEDPFSKLQSITNVV